MGAGPGAVKPCWNCFQDKLKADNERLHFLEQARQLHRCSRQNIRPVYTILPPCKLLWTMAPTADGRDENHAHGAHIPRDWASCRPPMACAGNASPMNSRPPRWPAAHATWSWLVEASPPCLQFQMEWLRSLPGDVTHLLTVFENHGMMVS